MTTNPESITDHRCLAGIAYENEPRFYDEWFTEKGELRLHCQPFAKSLLDLNREQLHVLWERVHRQLYENGITYHIHREDGEKLRPWNLDPIPLLLPEEEWRKVEHGLLQRAHIYNHLLVDIYGPQRLIRERLLPAEFVFANPAFLRACMGIQPPRHVWLHRYTVDLARLPDGNWYAVSDRTQVPGGAGYALENRLILSRLFSKVMGEHNIRRLAGYFKQFRESLIELIPPSHREDPRIVLLTSGPAHESFFEHSYLAKYLGISLVEGADLTVRDNTVYLKTLEGLEPIDGIVRRIPDWCSDSLWLTPESNLGVPGLLQAARMGKVAIANALGSGILESSVLLPFLPDLCRFFLAEDLQIPSVQTWWCGNPSSLQYVLDHFDTLVIKAAFPRTDFQTVFVPQLSQTERGLLRDRIRTQPYAFTAQEKLSFSTAPVWIEDSLQARHLMVRTHVVARSGGGYAAMPGGLTRVASMQGSFLSTRESGGAYKDTWIFSSQPSLPLSLLPPTGAPVELRRAPRNLPSRVADNLFWVSRYLERTENDLRSIRLLLTRLTSPSEFREISEWRIILELISALFNTPVLVCEGNDDVFETSRVTQWIEEWIYRTDNEYSLWHALDRLHDLTWKVRDRISTDAWRILTQFEQELFAPRNPVDFNDLLDRINRMLMGLAAFSGLEMESMTRSTGWRFLDMGRRLERALNMITVVEKSLVVPHADETGVLKILLELLECSMTYRSRYVDELHTGAVIDLIMLDETNPRSVVFQIAALVDHVGYLPHRENHVIRTREERAALSAFTQLRLADAYSLIEVNPEGLRWRLNELCSSLENELPSFSDALSLAYFSHAEELQHLSKQKR